MITTQEEKLSQTGPDSHRLFQGPNHLGPCQSPHVGGKILSLWVSVCVLTFSKSWGPKCSFYKHV